jgi:DNA processing protein
MEESKPAVALAGDEEKVYAALVSSETHINELGEKTGLALPTISATLMKLEMKRVVKPLPGKFYVRVV